MFSIFKSLVNKYLPNFKVLNLKAYKYDIASLFNDYNFINVSKFAQVAGINASLMRQYKTGNQYISENQVLKIEDALHKIANEIAAIKLV